MPVAPDPKPDRGAQPPGETMPSEAWVGVRVVVRSLVRGERGPSGGPAMTDAVGVVESSDASHLVVRRRDGSTRTIATADVVAIKPAPAPSQRPDRGSAP